MRRLREALFMGVAATIIPGAGLVLGQGASEETQDAVVQEAPRKAEPKAEPAEAKPAAKAKAVQAVRIRQGVLIRKRQMPQVPEAVIDAQVEQYLQQLRPMARAEYYFIKKVTELKDDQRMELARATERAARAASRKFVENQQAMMRGNAIGGNVLSDPRKLIEEEFVKSVSFLSGEQQARYQRERELRKTSQQRMFIDNMVCKLDAELILDEKQREQLTSSMTSKWDDQWMTSLDMLMNIDHFFPSIPDEVVVPCLTEKQKGAWSQIPRSQGGMMAFGTVGVMMDNDPLDDPELLQAQEEAAKAREHR